MKTKAVWEVESANGGEPVLIGGEEGEVPKN
jgi:hypothetical protein